MNVEDIHKELSQFANRSLTAFNQRPRTEPSSSAPAALASTVELQAPARRSESSAPQTPPPSPGSTSGTVKVMIYLDTDSNTFFTTGVYTDDTATPI